MSATYESTLELWQASKPEKGEKPTVSRMESLMIREDRLRPGKAECHRCGASKALNDLTLIVTSVDRKVQAAATLDRTDCYIMLVDRVRACAADCYDILYPEAAS